MIFELFALDIDAGSCGFKFVIGAGGRRFGADGTTFGAAGGGGVTEVGASGTKSEFELI